MVTLSPTIASTRAPRIGFTGSGVGLRSVKNGGSWMYVLLSSNANSSPPFIGISFHCSFLWSTLVYSLRNIAGEIEDAMTSCTSADVGQMSFR